MRHTQGHPPPPEYIGLDPMGQPLQPQGWMGIPKSIPNCPPGLEYLNSIDQLLVHQKVELLEAMTGFETNNKFTIKNSLGQKVYWAAEDNDCLTRNCLGQARPFELKVMDAYQNHIITFEREFACQSCCFPCCLQKMNVSTPQNGILGKIVQEWSFITPMFTLRNAADEIILKIEGPCCQCKCCADVEFKITTIDDQQVGMISKQWTGLTREMFTDADHFGVSFPLDLDVRMKAVCLGAVFLIVSFRTLRFFRIKVNYVCYHHFRMPCTLNTLVKRERERERMLSNSNGFIFLNFYL